MTLTLHRVKGMSISGRPYYRSKTGKYYCIEDGKWFQTCKQGEPQEALNVESAQILGPDEIGLTFTYPEVSHESKNC